MTKDRKKGTRINSESFTLNHISSFPCFYLYIRKKKEEGRTETYENKCRIFHSKPRIFLSLFLVVHKETRQRRTGKKHQNHFFFLLIYTTTSRGLHYDIINKMTTTKIYRRYASESIATSTVQCVIYCNF
jgi:hypothetical protein